MICIDNSEFMRNSDFVPSRFEAQHDAVNLIAGAKSQQHPENTVAILAMASAGMSPDILTNLTSDYGQLITSMHKAKIEGDLHFVTSLNVARLALKHRQNRHQAQRIVAFVSSPLTASATELTQLGKKLKKNNISVDVINFGEEVDNTERLEAFIEAVNRDGTSHLVTVPAGPHILSDILVSSALVRGDGGSGDDAGGMAVDPEMDPELAMALRLSMEEHERETAAAQPGDASTVPPSAPAAQEYDMDEEMRLAIEMSLAESEPQPSATSAPAASAAETPAADRPADADFVHQVLETLPGVDPSDPRIQNAIQNITQEGTGDDVEMKDDTGDAKNNSKK